MAYDTIKLDVDGRGVALLTLNRPKFHNALDRKMIDELHEVALKVADDENVRVVVLTGTGKSFCAGGDIGWFRDNLAMKREGRIKESRALAEMLKALYNLPKPLIGKINGGAYGGGAGMVSVCDIAVADSAVRFGLTEVRLGLIPANVSPYVVARIGPARSRSIMLSGVLFGAERALALGLIDEVSENLDSAIEIYVNAHLEASSAAVAATKKLITFVNGHQLEESIKYTSEALADAWETDDGREGIASFLGKRLPNWRSEG